MYVIYKLLKISMSANDILDVLNVQRDNQSQPPKKKQKVGHDQGPRQTGMARELYNLLGPNTPPVNLNVASSNTGIKDKLNLKPSPWTRMPFTPLTSKEDNQVELFHWVKGSKELLEQEESTNKKPYFFEKFNTKIDIPKLVDEETFHKFMSDIREREINKIKELKEKEQEEKQSKEIENKDEKNEKNEKSGIDNKKEDEDKDRMVTKEDKDINDTKDDKSELGLGEQSDKEHTENEGAHIEEIQSDDNEWTYEETNHLFELCNAFELKWPIVYDRFNYPNRSLEDLKEQFYRICAKILQSDNGSHPALLDLLNSYSKPKEVERKQYLESLLKRTPAEIAEEESLVIEARRFELAAKKMLVERSHLLTLLDSPQTTQSVQQYQSSQGLANLYNNLMIIDKHQKKRQFQQQQRTNNNNQEPVPPPIPIAASSSFKKERNFQTHLQQYLSGFLKQNQSSESKQEPNAIQQLLMKRLTVKEEEAYGLHYHANEKLTPGVILRSTQRLPGLQQRQSVLKSVNSILQELDIPTAGGTSWKPVMPTRKTMAKYDELLKSVVALLDIKKGKDKLESEIRLIKSQRGLQ